jgi:hypothetical protein
VLALCVALCCVASTVATTPSLRTLLAEQDTHTDAENPYLSEDARRVLAEETEEARLVVEEENGSDEESDAPPYPPMPPGANETHHHSWQSVNLHTHHHRHPPPPSVPPLHSPPHNPNAPGAYDPCVGKGTPKATVSCFPRPPSPPPSPGPPPYPPMLPLASVPPFSPQDLGGILSGSLTNESKEGYELMAAMFAFGGVGVVMGVMHWSKQQRSHALKYSALQDNGVPKSDVRVAGYGALSDNAAPHLPPAQNDDIWGRASYQEPDQAL